MTRLKPVQWRAWRLAGMMRSRERPMASSAEKPKIRSAPGFQKLMVPARSVAMIASDAVLSSASIRPGGAIMKHLRHNEARCTRPITNDIHSVSYTHLRAHETVLDLVCRLL